jgi:hypothetical protein
MIVPTRRAIVAYLVGTFLFGAIAGGALGYRWGRQPVFRSFDRDAMRAKFCNRLVDDLGLSTSQSEQLDVILRKNMDEFESAHREHYSQIGVLMKQHRERIASILNPDQKEKFYALEKEREERMEREKGLSKRRGGGGPPSEDPSPGSSKPAK